MKLLIRRMKGRAVAVRCMSFQLPQQIHQLRTDARPVCAPAPPLHRERLDRGAQPTEIVNFLQVFHEAARLPQIIPVRRPANLRLDTPAENVG
jgi:hypothetical protein